MIQITISEKDNPKVAGWLMDNNIEYSSVPVQEGKSKEEIALIHLSKHHVIIEGISEKAILDFKQSTFDAMEEYANQFKQPVPVSVGYREQNVNSILILNCSEFEHMKEISVYNNNYYKHKTLGYIIYEICHEEYNYYEYYLRVNDATLDLLGCSQSRFEDSKSIKIDFKKQYT